MPRQVLDVVSMNFCYETKYAPEVVLSYDVKGRTAKVESTPSTITVRTEPAVGAADQRRFATVFRNDKFLTLERRTISFPGGEGVWSCSLTADGRPKSAENVINYPGRFQHRYAEIEVTKHEDASPGPEAFSLTQFGLPDFADVDAPPSTGRNWWVAILAGVLLVGGGLLWYVRRSKG